MKIAIALLAACFLAFTAIAQKAPQPEPKMSFIDNGTVRLGIDLNRGGAITWLSKSGSELNVINSHDLGREVQMSFYAGPVPFSVGEKKPAPHWNHLGWNPVQAGDDFGHIPKLLEHKNDGRSLYVKCIPMHWPLDGVPGECTFESWLELDGAAVRARCRLNNARPDKTQYHARAQECPAVYVNAPFYKLMTYTGGKPFTNDALRRIEKTRQDFPWENWLATENWAALVNDNGWGLGVWNPQCVRFLGGFAGKPGVGAPKDNFCGYLAPQMEEILDHNIVHEYRYELALGTLDEIRRRFYASAKNQPLPPVWRFERDRQSWTLANATDSGWPLSGEWRVKLELLHPELRSPVFVARAEEAPVLMLQAALTSPHRSAKVFWRTIDEPKFVEKNSAKFEVKGDGEFHEYRVRLAEAPGWSGAVIQLRIDPVPTGATGASVRLRSVMLGK